MDVGTGVALAGSVIASKEVMFKVLGPTADYVGGELKNLVQRCNINLSNVFSSSLRKGAEAKPGFVDPRTFKAVVDDAAYCDDSLIKDYYGGILCGAKSEDGDDSALPYSQILKGLSRLQVKTHFLIYALLHKSLSSSCLSITREEDREAARLVFSYDRYFQFLKHEPADAEAAIIHTINGLIRVGLLSQSFRYGDPTYIKAAYPDAPVDAPSVVVCPSILGVELFLWAAGIKSPNPNFILNKDAELILRFPQEIQDEIKDFNLSRFVKQEIATQE